MSELSDLLGIIASLIGILAPVIGVLLKKSSGTDESQPSLSIVINNFGRGSHQSNSKYRTEQETIDHIIDLITNDRESFINQIPITLTASVIFVIIVFTIQYIDSSLFFVAGYVNDVLTSTSARENKELAYFFSLVVVFTGFFSISYFILWYVYDLKLKSILDNFSYLDKPLILGKIQKLLSNKNEINHFDVYPVKTLGRLITNAEIRTRNRRRSVKNQENENLFWLQKIIVVTFILIVATHFSFPLFFK